MSNRILVFYGSYRSDRMGIRLAQYVVEQLRRRGDDIELILQVRFQLRDLRAATEAGLFGLSKPERVRLQPEPLRLQRALSGDRS